MEHPKITITNMVMVYEKDTDRVLALDKIHPEWGGITFPGGKLMPGESIVGSAVREVKEETGLTVSDLVPCGVVHWAGENGDRYLEFLFRTCTFSGDLLPATHEGSAFWTTREAIRSSSRLSLNFTHYLPMFWEDKYSELYFRWDGKAWEGTPVYL